MLAPTLISVHALTLDIGGIPILVRTDSADFAHLLEDRYGEFVTAGTATAVMELEIKLIEPALGVRDSGLGLGVRGWELGARFWGLTPDSCLLSPDWQDLSFLLSGQRV